ncbi:MAG: MCE family protein [Fibrobacteres bacterium]|nr:MCE family protein [Fibrobacterota bacterium]
MDVSRAEKARLGIFLIGTAVLLVVVIFALVGKKIFTKKVPYFTRLSETVSGLELGTPVKQNGVDVGNIVAILTDTTDVTRSVVRFEVNKGTPVKQDMVASMGSYGITGLKYLELTGGSYSAPDVPPGGEIRSELSTLGKLTQRADSIAYKIDRLLGNVLALTESQGRAQLEKLVNSSVNLAGSLDSLTSDIARIRPGRRIDAILADAEAATSTLKDKIKKAEIDETVHEYRKLAEGAGDVAQKMDITILRVQEDLSQSMNNLKETMKNMNAFSRQIRENPSVLLRSEEKQERHK